MKKVLTCFLSFWAMCSIAQVSPSKYWIKLADKNNTPYTLSNPQGFLTQRAVNRRLLQNIPVDSTDLPINALYISAINATGAQVINNSKWFNSVTILIANASQLTAVQALPFVVSSQPVFKKYKTKTSDKFDPLPGVFAKQSIINRENDLHALNYGNSFSQINMIGANYLHVAGYQGQGVVIAVIDAGFLNVNVDPVFDSIRLNNQILGVRDFVTGDGSVYEDYYHGSAVLSTMGGNLPGQLIGTAPKANYWLLRSEDVGSEYLIEEVNWVIAAEFADSVGADIINSSLGYTTFDDANQNHTYAQMDGNVAIATIGADKAASKGIIVVNSAGNEGGTLWHYIGVPADGDSVFTIGAVDANRIRAGFSSTGPSYDGQIKPNVAAQGAGTIITDGVGGTFSGNGTSFSAPVISGATACLVQAFPLKTNMEILDAIQRSCDHYNSPDSLTGYGIPNYSIASLLLSQPEYAKKKSISFLDVFPNPFVSELDFVYYSAKSELIQITLNDITGRILYTESAKGYNDGYMKIRIPNSSELPVGMYFLKLSSPSTTIIKKVIKN